MKPLGLAVILGAVAALSWAPAPVVQAQTAVPAGTVELSPRMALAAKISSVSFEAVTLREVLDWVSTTLGTNVHVDWGALKEAGVEPEHPITLRLKMIAVDRLLRLILQETGVGDQLTFYVDGNVLEITSKAVADQQLFTRVYPIQDLMLIPSPITGDSGNILTGGNNSSRQLGSGNSGGSSSGFGNNNGGGNSIFDNNNSNNNNNNQSDADRAQQVIDMIKKAVPAEMWEENGGKAKITYFRGNLILTAPRSVHELIGGPILSSEAQPSKTAE